MSFLPQQNTLVLIPSAHTNRPSVPAAIAVIGSVSPITATGVGLLGVIAGSTPSCPESFAPPPLTLPLACSPPENVSPVAATTASVLPITAVGTDAIIGPPLPGCSAPIDAQHTHAPSVRTAHLCGCPPRNPVASDRPVTLTGSGTNPVR